MDEISLIDNDRIPEEIKKEQNKNENKQQGVKGKVLLFFLSILLTRLHTR